MMKFFKHCHNCVPPKRQPGCQSHCPDYAEDRAVYDGCKSEADKRRKVKNDIYSQRDANVTRALKKRR